MPHDVGILTYIVQQFLQVISAGYSNVLPDATKLFGLLAVIEIALLCIAKALSPDPSAITALIKKVLVMGFFLWIINTLPTLTNAMLDSFIQVGIKAGGSSISSSVFTDPSAIAGYGVKAADILFNQVSIWDRGVLDTIVLGVFSIVIMGCFFLIAIQVAMALLNFYIFVALSPIFFACGVNKHTSFIAEKAFGFIVSNGVKLMVLGFVLSVVLPILENLTPTESAKLAELAGIVLAALFIFILCWQAPAIAAGLMTGAPSLSAGTAVGAAMGAGLGASAAGATVGAVMNKGFSATKSAASAMGTLKGMADASFAGGNRLQGVAKLAGGAMKSIGSNVSNPLKNAYESGKAGGKQTIAGNSNIPSPASNATPPNAQPASSKNSSLTQSAMLAKSAMPQEAAPEGGTTAPINHNE